MSTMRCVLAGLVALLALAPMRLAQAAAASMTGSFRLDPGGAQTGEITPLGQMEPEGTRGCTWWSYPRVLATGRPVIGK